MIQAACGQNKSFKVGTSESRAPRFHRDSDTNSGNEATPGNSLFAPVDPSPRKLREDFVLGAWLLLNRVLRHAPLDARSLRSLASTAEALARNEERAT